MKCTFALATLSLLFLVTAASAQEWAEKMFKVTKHDFGAVARGAELDFAFELENIYEEDVHISSVRSSCGCTTPKITRPTLKTWEKGAIMASLNTRTHLGQKKATLTVVLDKPFPAEVRLEVDVFIRKDVVFTPGAVQFGEVSEGEAAEETIRVAYAGSDNWKIVDILSANESLEAQLRETSRGSGRVEYDMVVRLRKDAQVGYLQDQLTLVTSDGSLKRIPLAVEGRVTSSLTVSPGTLFLGVVKPGERVTKQLVVRGKSPFRIEKVQCPDGCFKFETTEELKKLHIVPVTFTAPDDKRKVTETIEIRTNRGNAASFTATATIDR